MTRYAFYTTFPARGFVVDMMTGLPVTYSRAPTVVQRKRCDPYGIARVVAIRIHLPETDGRPTYEILDNLR